MEHQGDSAGTGRLIIRSNRNHPNFDLFETPAATEEASVNAFARRYNHYLVGHMAFADALVVCLRIDGLDQIQTVAAMTVM